MAASVLSQAPFRIATATTRAEFEAIFRLRYQVVVEMGWAPPETFPDGLENDEHDAEAIQVGAWDGAKLAATSRVILPGSKGLPLEREFGIRAEPHGELVEVGRTATAKRYRGDERHVLVMSVFCQVWREMRAHGFHELVSATPARLIEVYRGMGFKTERLGPAQVHWGEERYPVRFDVHAAAQSLARVWKDPRA